MLRPVLLVVVAAAAIGPAVAAPPDYCAFFAREYVVQFELGADEAALARELGDQAYFRCLNQDAAPALPAASAYAGTDLDAATVDPAPVAEGDAELPDEEIVAEEVAERSPQRSRSGLEPWSEEWRTWCERHFPNSFDPVTGFVLPYNGRRRFC